MGYLAVTQLAKASVFVDSLGFISKTRAPQHLLGIAGPLDLDSRGHSVDLIEIVGGELDREGSQILIQVVEPWISIIRRYCACVMGASSIWLSVSTVFLGMKAVVPVMERSGGGSIVNISSVAGLKGSPGSFAYAATKWALRGMTKSTSAAANSG